MGSDGGFFFPWVICCADPALVPQDELPLQTCLHFAPCPPALAVSFLQSVCRAEGHAVPRARVEAVYAETHPAISSDEPEPPSVPYPSQPPPCADLRHALNRLQFSCAAPGITPGGWPEILADWTRAPGCSPGEGRLAAGDLGAIASHAESASYTDGHLERRPWDVLEVRLPAHALRC